MAKRLNLLRKAQQSAGELGGAVFEYFLSLVEHERYTQSVNCLHVYNQAFDYIESQRASFDEGQEQASRKAEYYLKEKIEPAIQIVRSKPVGKLSPRDLGLLKTAQQHIEQLDIDIDEFKELSKQLTLAKNILKGGARLDKANGQQDPKLQSDELYGLSVEDGSQRLLSPAEIGIIIAISMHQKLLMSWSVW